MGRRSLAFAAFFTLVVSQIPVSPAAATTSVQPLPFSHDWTNIAEITLNDDWSAVPGIVGYLGDDATTTATGIDPQTILAEFATVDVIANQTSTAITNGGVAEFHLADPVVALQGSGTADAPHLVLTLDTSGASTVTVAYNLRDIDGSTDNAIQPVALQYRIGVSGPYTNLLAGFVADATTGPSLATLVTPVSTTLPADASDRPVVQVRIITTNAAGSDEWVGVDDIAVTATVAPDAAPTVSSTSPANGATGVAVNANVSVTFSEPVNVVGNWYAITCATSGPHTAIASGGPTSFTLDPDANFAASETCTLAIVAGQVTDQDANDPPDAMVADHVVSFTVAGSAALTPQPLPFFQSWTDNGLITTDDIWSGVPGIIGYRGDDLTTTTGTDPRTITADGSATPVDVIANQTSTAISNGGVAEFHLADPVVAMQGSGTADAPHLVLTLDTRGASNVRVAYNLRDIDGSIDNAIQPVALQYRVGTSGSYTNVPAGFVADATTGPSLAAQVTPVSVFLPADAADQPIIQVRIITTNAAGNDEWVGVDDIAVTGADAPPTVSSNSPANGATGVAASADITVTFSEPVTVAGAWYAIACAASGAHSATASSGSTTYTIDPSSDFLGGETCTVTIYAANVTDQDDPLDTMASNHTFTFQTMEALTCGDPATPIHVIQGSDLTSTMVGSAATIEGVVVGDYQATTSEFGGFYLQEETADSDDNALTSEGIFVFDNGFGIDVSPGDVVRVRGTVTEFFNLTELGSVNAVVKCADGASVPATPVSLPVANVNDLERFEGMLVSFEQTLTATEVFNLGRFGEVSLSGVGRLYTPTAVATPGAAAIAQLAQNNRSRIILDDGNNQQNIDPTRYPQGGLSAANTLRVGDTLSSLTGVMDYRFTNYRIQPVGPITWSHTNPRTTAPAPVGGNLKIASFNVLNFFNGDGLGGGFPTSRGANTAVELQRQLAKEVSALTAINADIVGLMEIENDAGANSALAQLVAALNSAVGAGTYSYINTGVIGTDEIKVALIYKTAAVTPVGAFMTITSAIDPTFIDTLNRPSLAQTFRHGATGQQLTVVVNHLKSKGSACSGDPDTGDGQGNCNLTRTAAAAALARWLGTDPTGSGDPDFLIIGDLNSYTFEDPITTLTTSGYVNLVGQFGGLTAYSYVFNGESGYLDHALATASLASQVTGATDWHINPDEPTVLDYNVEFKTANQVNTFYAPGPYRSSDHDPVVIGLHLNSAPTANANGPYSVGEGASVTLTASATDPDADSLIYEWDLDNNGTFETPGQSVTFSAAAIDGPATRTVNVRVSDGEDATVATTTVNVSNVAPTATAGGPYAGVPFAPVTFSGNATDPAGAADVLTYAWDFDYDGTFATDASGVNLRNPSHPYAAPGNYRVALRVTDEDGGVATVAIATVSIGAPASTGGKVEGTSKWGDSLKTKINVHSADGEINGRIEIDGDGWSYESTRLDSIVVTGADATVFGAFGSVTFRLDIHDGGKEGTDTLRLRITNGYDSGVLTEPRGQLTVFAK